MLITSISPQTYKNRLKVGIAVTGIVTMASIIAITILIINAHSFAQAYSQPTSLFISLNSLLGSSLVAFCILCILKAKNKEKPIEIKPIEVKPKAIKILNKKILEPIVYNRSDYGCTVINNSNFLFEILNDIGLGFNAQSLIFEYFLVRNNYCMPPQISAPTSEKIESFTQCFKPPYRDKIIDIFKNHVQFFSFEDLKSNLALCVQELNKLINEDFAVGHIPEKSNEWVTSMALSSLSRIPSDWFDVRKLREELVLPVNIKTWVFFDDVGYSGSQMANIFLKKCMEVLFQKLDDKDQISQYRFYVVIPFTTSKARACIEECFSKFAAYMAWEKRQPPVTKLITSPLLMPHLDDDNFGVQELDVFYQNHFCKNTLCYCQ